MEQATNTQDITDEGAALTVDPCSGGRTCLVTHDALHYLSSLHDHTTDAGKAVNAFEEKIRRMAQQLPDWSQASDVFILDTKSFSAG